MENKRPKAASKTKPKRRKVQSRVKRAENIPVDAHERGKDYFDESEINELFKAAKKTRYGARDYCLILMMYRHGFRVSEIAETKITDINFKTARLWVGRLKGSLSTEQPMEGDEIRALKRYLATREDYLPWVFITERGSQMTRKGIYELIKRLGKKARLPKAHPHMLRHSCGYYLANKGIDSRIIQDYLGHRNPRHTTRYTRIAGSRFEGLWSKRGR